ncbi:hypothetical protein FOA52_002215 [Chlamydomonas sp. UWO 241]|nr:hypothetical protein FOA52_002215 [Chlamydomonas sp. UWO 241]
MAPHGYQVEAVCAADARGGTVALLTAAPAGAAVAAPRKAAPAEAVGSGKRAQQAANEAAPAAAAASAAGAVAPGSRAGAAGNVDAGGGSALWRKVFVAERSAGKLIFTLTDEDRQPLWAHFEGAFIASCASLGPEWQLRKVPVEGGQLTLDVGALCKLACSMRSAGDAGGSGRVGVGMGAPTEYELKLRPDPDCAELMHVCPVCVRVVVTLGHYPQRLELVPYERWGTNGGVKCIRVDLSAATPERSLPKLSVIAADGAPWAAPLNTCIQLTWCMEEDGTTLLGPSVLPVAPHSEGTAAGAGPLTAQAAAGAALLWPTKAGPWRLEASLTNGDATIALTVAEVLMLAGPPVAFQVDAGMVQRLAEKHFRHRARRPRLPRTCFALRTAARWHRGSRRWSSSGVSRSALSALAGSMADGATQCTSGGGGGATVKEDPRQEAPPWERLCDARRREQQHASSVEPQPQHSMVGDGGADGIELPAAPGVATSARTSSAAHDDDAPLLRVPGAHVPTHAGTSGHSGEQHMAEADDAGGIEGVHEPPPAQPDGVQQQLGAAQATPVAGAPGRTRGGTATGLIGHGSKVTMNAKWLAGQEELSTHQVSKEGFRVLLLVRLNRQLLTGFCVEALVVQPGSLGRRTIYVKAQQRQVDNWHWNTPWVGKMFVGWELLSSPPCAATGAAAEAVADVHTAPVAVADAAGEAGAGAVAQQEPQSQAAAAVAEQESQLQSQPAQPLARVASAGVAGTASGSSLWPGGLTVEASADQAVVTPTLQQQEEQQQAQAQVKLVPVLPQHQQEQLAAKLSQQEQQEQLAQLLTQLPQLNQQEQQERLTQLLSLQELPVLVYSIKDKDQPEGTNGLPQPVPKLKKPSKALARGGGGQDGLKKQCTTLHSLRAQAAVLPGLPSCVAVYCRSLRGELLLLDFVVRCMEGCKACGKPGASCEPMSPGVCVCGWWWWWSEGAFEAHAGRAVTKTWCRSIRLVEIKEPSGEGMPIGKWLKQQCVVFTGDGVAHAHAQVVDAGAAGPSGAHGPTDVLVPSTASTAAPTRSALMPVGVAAASMGQPSLQQQQQQQQQPCTAATTTGCQGIARGGSGGNGGSRAPMPQWQSATAVSRVRSGGEGGDGSLLRLPAAAPTTTAADLAAQGAGASAGGGSDSDAANLPALPSAFDCDDDGDAAMSNARGNGAGRKKRLRKGAEAGVAAGNSGATASATPTSTGAALGGAPDR